MRLKAILFPYDNCDLDEMLEHLASVVDRRCKPCFIIRYVVDGLGYIQVVNFSKHQYPNKNEPDSRLPPPPDWDVIPLQPVVEGSDTDYVAEPDEFESRTGLKGILLTGDKSTETETVNPPTPQGERPPLRVVPRAKPEKKPNKSAQVIDAIRANGFDPELSGRDHAAIKGCTRAPDVVADAYVSARQRLWPPGDPWLANNLSVHAVIERLDGFEAWVAAGRPSSVPRPAKAVVQNSRYHGDEQERAELRGSVVL